MKPYEKKIIPESAHDHYSYNPITGLFTAIKDIGIKILKGDVIPNYSDDSYKIIRISGIQYMTHRVAWFMYYGEQPNIVDHLNHRRDCNRITNLKSGTTKENNHNRCTKISYFQWKREQDAMKVRQDIRDKIKRNREEDRIIRKLKAELNRTCEYKADKYGVYSTGCSNELNTGDFSLCESDFEYCTYCGGKIKEVHNVQN